MSDRFGMTGNFLVHSAKGTSWEKKDHKKVILIKICTNYLERMLDQTKILILFMECQKKIGLNSTTNNNDVKEKRNGNKEN